MLKKLSKPLPAKIAFLIVILCLFIAPFAFGSEQTEIIYLSGKGSDDTVPWDFKVTSGRRADQWSTIPVPSNWELQGFGTYNYGHDRNKADEQGWYRRQFALPKSWDNKRLFLVFEGVMTDTKVKVNGTSAGPKHQGGFYRFHYDITSLVSFKKMNDLQVIVDKVSANESINQAERQGDYWIFGGIYRPVYIKAVPKEYIDWVAIDGRADGTFLMDVTCNGVKQADRLYAQIFSLEGESVGKQFVEIDKTTNKTRINMQVPHPKLWSAESPHLYVVNVTLMKKEKPLHTVRQRFGFRTFEVREGKGLFLNDRHIVLKGCDRHSFWPSSGRALNRNLCRDDITLMKEMNMNAVRMSHYPPDSYFLDLCDELGMYVLDELAGWQKPPYDTQTGERLVEQMVKRDVNHPCILFWDNGNEGGWNRELDDEFAKWDIQERKVLHPWELFNGVDTDHYENYASTRDKLNSGHIYMPTEALHGLYDGGLGAGLEDYWNLMWGNPLTGGLFLWVFADEGIVRTDRNGAIDTDGNHAPDGILGPFHQREASFYTIKEIWSPIYIDSNTPISKDFNGRIPVENRYDFTNLNTCRFDVQWVKYAHPHESWIGHQTLYRQRLKGPDVPARAVGELILDVPNIWNQADGLIVTARDGAGNEVYTWKWKLKSAEQIAHSIFNSKISERVVVEENYTVSAGEYTFSFDKSNGRLISVHHGEYRIPFGNGPRFVANDIEDNVSKCTLKITEQDTAVVIAVQNHPCLNYFWTIYGDRLKLDYTYSHEGEVDYMGISFDYPETRVFEKKWLGRGPYRVWKNRIKGTTMDVWHNTYVNFKVNTAWDYPEFAGYFADVNWVRLLTQDGPITIVSAVDDLFLRLYSQEDGDNPRHTKMIRPPGDISFLHAIPAIGTKFKPAEELGAMSEPFPAEGEYEGVLYFYFGSAVAK